MRTPPYLEAGDKVGIVATARKVNKADLDTAIKVLSGWSLEVVLSPLIFTETHSYLAGTDEQRAASLQQFLDDPSVKAILCARGGYGTTRIIESVDYRQFLTNPKWIAGFSDVTSLHLVCASLGIKSIHGIMPVLFSRQDAKESVGSLYNALFGKPVELTASPSKHNRPGKATGILTGGNLSLLVDSLGTPYEIEAAGRILVLEEVDEYFYKVDRMLVQLKRAGKLDKLAGLAIGHFSDMKDTALSFGETTEEIVRFHTREYSYPVAFGFPTGHINPNFSWVVGENGLLDVNNETAVLKLGRE